MFKIWFFYTVQKLCWLSCSVFLYVKKIQDKIQVDFFYYRLNLIHLIFIFFSKLKKVREIAKFCYQINCRLPLISKKNTFKMFHAENACAKRG